MNIPFEYPLFLLVIPPGLYAIGRLVRQKGHIGYSTSSLLKGINTTIPLIQFERFLLTVFLVTITLVLAHPTRSVKNSVPVYQQARDITIVLDISSSMSHQKGEKFKTAVSVITDFVSQRTQDRIALFSFDNKAYLEWPLSPDHEALVFRLNQIKPDGSTVISAGFIAGLEHQRQFGKNTIGALIIVSDGSSSLIPREKEMIETTLGQTKLYWIWIDSGYNDIFANQFAGYFTSLGGKVYEGGLDELDEIFAEINQLEASPVVWEHHVTTVYRFGILPHLAFISLFLTTIVHYCREI